MPAVPLHRGAHAGSGSGSAAQRHGQGAAVGLPLLRRRQGAAAAEQALPPGHRRLRAGLQLSGRR